MDGFGLREETAGNAIANARKPFLGKVFAECPGCKLSASGLDGVLGVHGAAVLDGDGAGHPGTVQGADGSTSRRNWPTGWMP